MEKVAVIDDDAQFLSVIVRYLQGRGFEVEGFASLQSANKSINASIKLAVVDLSLSDGNGFELIGKITKKYPGIKTIVITGYDELPKRLKSFALGADDYLKKPVSPAELVARIQRLLKRKDIVQAAPLLLPSEGLSPEEEQVYSVLNQSVGGFIPKEKLRSLVTSDNALYVLLSRLKKKLPKEYTVKNAYGRGYYLKKIVL